MKSKRFRNYVESHNNSKAMTQADVKHSKDAKTDEDFPGFPNGQSTPKMIHPVTETEKTAASVNIKDGDKMTDADKANAQNKVVDTKEELSDGSGGAFEATEGNSDQH